MSEPERKEETTPNSEPITEEEPATPRDESASEETVVEPMTEPVEEKAEEIETEAEEGEAPEEEIEVVEEKVYTISLRHAWVVTPRGRRAPRVVRDVRDFVSRHMKAEEVAMSDEINSALWSRGINKPPRKITVRAVKDKEGKVIVYPAKA